VATSTRRGYPVTRRDKIFIEAHGYHVADPYRWLESGASDEVRRWVAEQNNFTRRFLDTLPHREPIRRELRQLMDFEKVGLPTIAAGKLFYTRRYIGQNYGVLFMREGVDGEESELINTNESTDNQSYQALTGWYPSPDARLLAYSICVNDDERPTLHIMKIGEKEQLPDQIPGFAGDLAWLGNDGFFYTRYPSKGKVPKGEEFAHIAVYIHRLGDEPSHDQKVSQPEEYTEIPHVSVSPNGKWLLIITEQQNNENNGIYILNLMRPGSAVVQLLRDIKAAFKGAIANDRLFLLTDYDAPNSCWMYIDLNAEDYIPHVLIAERGDVFIINGAVMAGKISVLEKIDDETKLNLYSLDGSYEGEIPIDASNVQGVSSDFDGENIFLGLGLKTRAADAIIYRYHVSTKTLSIWLKVAHVPVEQPNHWIVEPPCMSDDHEIEIEMWYPVSGLPNPNAPIVLQVYGGFGNDDVMPGYAAQWIRMGGVFAIAHIRGGGVRSGSNKDIDKRRAHYLAGKRLNKQKSIDDTIAAAEHLIHGANGNGITTPDRLALLGSSNGGMIVGGAITQRPNLFRAAVCIKPMFDMLRAHKFGKGIFMEPEYGTADNPEEFRYLRSYSPYHSVRPNTRYPAMLIISGENDNRVHPMHARKMAAALQAASNPQHLALLLEERNAGHGDYTSMSAKIEEQVDVWSFLYKELAVPIKRTE